MKLFYLFAYSSCLAMFLPLFFPFWHILYFAPFLVLCFYRCSLIRCLWWSFICGLVIDLFSAETRLGTYAMNHCLTTLCLYRYKFYFFEDRLSTLPAMTFGFSCLSMLIQFLILYLLHPFFSLSWKWIVNDLLLLPLEVAFYAFLAFTLPTLFLSDLKRRYLLFRWARRTR
jgi:hypothetical protein